MLTKVSVPVFMKQRQAEPLPCEDEIILVDDWVVVALPEGVFEGILKAKSAEWGFAIVEVEYSAMGTTHMKRVRVWETNIRRMSCWLDDPQAAPHMVDNYLW